MKKEKPLPILNAVKRSRFLSFSAFLANFFLFGFLFDTCFSVGFLIYIAATGANVDALPLMWSIPVVTVFLAALVMLPLLLFVPQLPKLVLLPPALFLIWTELGAFPFSPAAEDLKAFTVITVLQIVLAFGAFFINRARTGNFWISTYHLPRLEHIVLRTVAATITFLLLTPLVIGAMGLMTVASAFERKTDHFIDFTFSQMDVRERVFTKGVKSVHLIGMMHFGESNAYDALFSNFPAQSLVLAEGVTDRQRLLSGNLSYQGVAKILGLEQQPRLQQNDRGGKAAITSDLNGPPSPQDGQSGQQDDPVILSADRDISDFSKTTIQFLSAVIKVYSSDSLAQTLGRFSALNKNFSEQDAKVVFDDILNKRNDHVLAALDARINDYDTIIIPWGALHMPGLQNGLMERGFTLTHEKTSPLIHYTTILTRAANALQAL